MKDAFLVKISPVPPSTVPYQAARFGSCCLNDSVRVLSRHLLSLRVTWERGNTQNLEAEDWILSDVNCDIRSLVCKIKRLTRCPLAKQFMMLFLSGLSPSLICDP